MVRGMTCCGEARDPVRWLQRSSKRRSWCMRINFIFNMRCSSCYFFNTTTDLQTLLSLPQPSFCETPIEQNISPSKTLRSKQSKLFPQNSESESPPLFIMGPTKILRENVGPHRTGIFFENLRGWEDRRSLRDIAYGRKTIRNAARKQPNKTDAPRSVFSRSRGMFLISQVSIFTSKDHGPSRRTIT